MKKTGKKLLSVLLAVVMACSVMPFAVFAEEWKTAQSEAAAEAETEANEPLQGDLIAAEITVGNTKSTYALNEEGKLELVSEETVKTKRGLFKAPKKETSVWDSFSDDTLLAAANWAMTNPIGTATTFTDGNGVAAVIYGAAAFGTLKDETHDLKCDDCGYCLNGCIDGTRVFYNEDDIKSGPDAEGKYYNGPEYSGTWVATDAHGEYTYTEVDEDGNTVYEADGTTPKKVKVEYDYIQYESYMAGTDGKCDVCENDICSNHQFADGLCDGCGGCMGEHTDNEEIDLPDGNCDECGQSVGHTHTDEADGVCDECGQPTTHMHTDAENDGTCDECGQPVAHNHKDEVGDGTCDECGLLTTHTHTDVKGATQIGNGKCDVCGYCVDDCADNAGAVDAENNPIGDGKCDVCGKAMLAFCDHSDLLGAAVCGACGQPHCHLRTADLQQPALQLSAISEILASRDSNPETPASFHDWLNGTLKTYINASKNGSGTGIGDEMAKRNEMESAYKTNRMFTGYVEGIQQLTVSDVTSSALVGKLKRTESGTELNESDSLFAQVAYQISEYQKAADTVYDASAEYFTEKEKLDHISATLNGKLTDLACELFDSQLAAIYGGSTPKWLNVDNMDVSDLRTAIRALDEALLYKLYTKNWRTDAVNNKASLIWSGKNTSPSYSNDQERRSVGFAMLDYIQTAINARGEKNFTEEGFKQTTYDNNGAGYYAKREARADDILRDPDKDADDYIVYDETIKTVISNIDGYLSSAEAVATITRILPDTFGIDVKDYDGDSAVTMYDLLMSFLAQLLFDDDTINSIFALIFPTVTSLPAELPDMLSDNEYVSYRGDGKYRIDIVKAITLLAGGSASLGSTLSDILDVISVGGSFDFDVDGGRAKTMKELLTDAGFRFWPEQVASLLTEKNSSGKYNSIIYALKHCDDNWNNLLTGDKLDFEWKVSSFNDFKDILSVLLGSISPLLEMIFSDKIVVQTEMDLSDATYFSLLFSLAIISIPMASSGGLDFYPASMHIYDDVIVPIFEALGVNSFAPFDNSTVDTYQFNHIRFTSNDTTGNVGMVVNGLLDPVFTLLKQFATHPLEKLLSILPNISLMLENEKLLELLDIDNTYSAYIRADFNTSSISKFFEGLGDIIEDQIMKHWYDWLNPIKYAQLIATTIAYMAFQPLIGLLAGMLGLIDLEWVAEMGILDVSDFVNGFMSDDVFPLLPELFDKVAGLLGGKLKSGAFPSKEVWPKDVHLNSSSLLGNLNFYELINKYFTSSEAVNALGFSLAQPSSLLNWFFKNLVDENGKAIHLFDLELLDFATLSSLGTLEKRTGSVRDYEYSRRWNTLNNGQYYFVNADISDVFYFCVNLLSGILTDKTAIKTILSMIGMDYDSIADALANITQEQMDALELKLNLSDILKNCCEGGKLSLDRLLDNLTTENILVVLCETLAPTNTYASTLSYPQASEATASEVASHDGTIPYLEYDNSWTQPMASFVTDDLDDFADALLQELPFDLNKDTPEIETLREFAKPLLLKYLNEPAYLTTIIRLLVELLSGLFDESLALPIDLLKDATGIDIKGWINDYAYLFDDSAAPDSKVFPLLTGERTGRTDENGDPLVSWTYDGKAVETYGDILAALGYLLTPVQPLLDMLFTDTDFRVMPYNKNGEPTGRLVTVKGNRGYNDCLLPLLEAMGIKNVMTEAEFMGMGTAKALLKCLEQVVDHLFEIFDSPTMLADLFEMLAQVMYALSGNGLGTLTKNFLHPLWVLLDTLRPIVNIDLDALANTLLCRFTYRFGEYSSERDMQQVMKDRNMEISLKTLSVDKLLNVFKLIASIKVGYTRKSLDILSPYQTAVNDLACLREEYTSKATETDGTQRTAYRLNTNGADALTSMMTMGMEILMYGSNADVIDTVIDRFFGQKGIVKTAIELMNGLPAEYTSDYNWAYILGEDATAQDKIDLLAEGSVPAAAKRTIQSQQDFAKYLESYDMTNWDEETAVHLAERLDDMIANALSIDTGNGKLLGSVVLEKLGVTDNAESYTLGSFVLAAANNLLTDEMLDKMLGILGDFLNGRDNPVFEKLAEKINPKYPENALAMIQKASALLKQFNESLCKAATVVGIDLRCFNIDTTRTVMQDGTVIYYDFNGNPTGLTRPVIADDLSNLEEVLYQLTVPVQPLLAFLLLGKNLSLFNASGVTANRGRRDDLIDVTGLESYRYVLLPLLEAIGCEDLKAANDYVNGDNYDVDALMHDLLASVVNRVRTLLTEADGKQVIDGLLGFVPDLLYYINSNGLGVSVQNLTAQITAILNFYNDYAGRTDADGSTKTTEDDVLTLSGLIKQFTDLDVDLVNIELTDLFSLLRKKDDEGEVHSLKANAFITRLLNNFTVGKIYHNENSVCDFDTYRMTYLNSQDKAATITILVSVALDLLEDPDNEVFWNSLLGKNVHRTLLNVLNLNEFKFDYQDPSWLFTEYADTDYLVTALTLSKLFDTDPYAGTMWTREMAAELVENIESFINDMLYLLGLEINGIKITDLRSLIHALVGGMLFSQDMMNRLTALLGQIKPLLDKYDPDRAIADFIKKLTDIDLHAWDAYAPGGEYENGKDWGFSTDVTEEAVDANGEIFEKALIELLSPLAPGMAWMLADSDLTFFVEGDGLGENADPIQLTIPGAEGYKYALVPLFEALNIDGSPKNLTQNLRDGDICDPAVYTANVKEDVSFAVTGVVHPLVAMIQKLMDSTATQLLELFPSIVYFINCNGIDTVVKNLIHSILIIGNAAEPMKEQISQLVYDEQGIDLYRTLNLEKLIREKLYTLIGVTENDVKKIYEQCGGTWTAVDGLEDFDFRLLFSIALAAVNNLLAKNGFPFKFTSIAALAVNELTHGYVRSFDSLTGKTAYTMVMDKTIDKYCLGDLLSILIRIMLKFLSVDGNADALVALIKTKAEINGVGEVAVSAFLHLLAGYMGTLGGFEVAMLSIYYTVYGASTASGKGVEAYDHVNDELGEVVDHLLNLDNDIARAVMQALLKAADENIGDIIGTKGLAGNGLIRFFIQIYNWLVTIINFVRAWLKK